MRRRIDLLSETFGFDPPPCRLDLMFLPTRPLTLLVHSPTSSMPAVTRWLSAYRPDHVHVGEGIAPRVLRAEFNVPPARWSQILDAVHVIHLRLTATGIGSLFLDDTDTRILAFEATLPEGPRSDPARAGPNGLTPKQFEILVSAVTLGYYEVPHRVTLRHLAKRVGMSLSGTSDLLRRAEAQVIKAQVDAMLSDGPPVDAQAAQEPEPGPERLPSHPRASETGIAEDDRLPHPGRPQRRAILPRRSDRP